MSKPKKILGLVLVLALVGALVTGVAYWSLGLDTTTRDVGLYVDDKRVEDPGVIMTIGEYEVSYNVYRYFYMNARYSLSQGNDSYWLHDPDGSREAYLLETVEDYILYYYTWMAIAEEYGIELTEEELAEIDETIENQKELFGTGFQDQLDGFYVADEETYRQINYLETLANKTIEEIYGIMAEEHRDEIEPTVLSAQHILIKTASYQDEDEMDVEEGEEPRTAAQQAEAVAQDILNEIEASDDPAATFARLRAEYDEDSGQPEEGYTFAEGEMVDEFYEAAGLLEEGEISGLVESTYGYHIILREPLNEDEVRDNLADVAGNWVYDLVTEKMEATEASLEITYGEYYSHISPANVR